MKTLKFIWATSLCMALGMSIVSCGDDNEEIEPSPNKEAEGDMGRHEYVDLGLSVKWATCNVGASSPEENGEYYAWGETETKNSYYWTNYKFSTSAYAMTKYCTNSTGGTVDNKTVLDPEDDVAHVKWGDNWRMPTRMEMWELKEKCKWTWTTLNGKNGCKVTSKSNGNSIFLPAAGDRFENSSNDNNMACNYWTSTLDEDLDHSAWCTIFDSNSTYVTMFWAVRYHGMSVRPVCP